MTYHIRFLDGGPICNWIGKWDTKFNDIRSSFLHREENGHGVLNPRVPGGHEGDQGRTCLCIASEVIGVNKATERTELFFASNTFRIASMVGDEGGGMVGVKPDVQSFYEEWGLCNLG